RSSGNEHSTTIDRSRREGAETSHAPSERGARWPLRPKARVATRVDWAGRHVSTPRLTLERPHRRRTWRDRCHHAWHRHWLLARSRQFYEHDAVPRPGDISA